MANEAGKKGQGWSRYIDPADNYGFFKFNNNGLNTLTERDYEAIVDDTAKWDALQAHMNADFNDELDMFPFEEQQAELNPNDHNWIENLNIAAGNWLKGLARFWRVTHLELPRRFFAIVESNIERRFPGGQVAGEPGDGDLRSMISDFRVLFKKNFARYTFKKRFYQFLATFVFFAVAMSATFFQPLLKARIAEWVGITDATTGLIVSGVVLFLIFALLYFIIYRLYSLFSRNAYFAYRNAQTESCKTLDKQAALRTKNLSNLISALMPRIDHDRADLIAQGRTGEWPERSRRWVLVVYWLGRRQEFLERFVQLEMWLIRRAHYFYRIASTLSNTVLLAVSLFALSLPVLALLLANWISAVFNLHMPPVDMPVLLMATFMSAVMTLHLWYVTGHQWNTELDLIKANMDIQNWDRYHDVHLPVRLADQVFSDKQFLLQREEWVAGKNR